MKKLLKRMFWPEPDPIEIKAPPVTSGPPEKEAEVRLALNRMTEAVISAANRSVSIRAQLAEDTIRLVSGDR